MCADMAFYAIALMISWGFITQCTLSTGNCNCERAIHAHTCTSHVNPHLQVHFHGAYGCMDITGHAIAANSD